MGRAGRSVIDRIRVHRAVIEAMTGRRLVIEGSDSVARLLEVLGDPPFPDSEGFSEDRVTGFRIKIEAELSSIVQGIADLGQELSRENGDGAPEIARSIDALGSLRKEVSIGTSWELARDRATEARDRAQGLPYDDGRDVARVLLGYLDVMEAIDRYELKRRTVMYYPDLARSFWERTSNLWSRGDPAAANAMLAEAQRLGTGIGDAIRAWREEAALTAGDPALADDSRLLAQQAHGALGTLGERLALAQLRAEVEQTRVEAEQTLDLARESAGVESVGQLIAGFGEFSSREAETANLLRRSTIGLSVLTVVAAVVVAFAFKVDTAAELAKLAWTLPLAGLAAYCGRESARHRGSADWAKVLDVQLKAIDNFCASLEADPHMSMSLRAAFGHHVFLSTLPDQRGDGDAGASSDLVRAIQQMAELAARSGAPGRGTPSASEKA